MSKFVIRETATGIKFDLVAGNGEPIGTSQVYASKATCKAGIESVKRVAPVAKMEDQTVENWEKVTNPKFEIYIDAAGEPRFRLRAANGQEILASQAYSSKEACEKGIASVVKNAPEAEVTEKEK
ncbi:MAG: YegP family protein [Eubacteriales bacterium]|nr:YegP family protein [Eubacteriales bacterium]